MEKYLFYPNKIIALKDIKEKAKREHLTTTHHNNKIATKTDEYDYDFSKGFRIKFKTFTNTYRLIITDKVTNQLYWDGIIVPEKDTVYLFPRRYLIEYKITIFKTKDDIVQYPPTDVINFDPNNKNILFTFGENISPAGLGDGIAFVQSIKLFIDKYKAANIYIHTSNPQFDHLLINSNIGDKLKFIRYDELYDQAFYATYVYGTFYGDTYHIHTTTDYKNLSLVEVGADIIGEKLPQKHSPLVYLDFKTHKPDKHYVCIGVHASCVFKEWHPKDDGKDKIVSYLNSVGYDVYAIDRKKIVTMNSIIKSDIPKGAIDATGERPLIEIAKFISNADFVIGYSSGISWLAWMCNVPTVLISGFTDPITEFETPYRVYNNHIECKGCWNNGKYKTMQDLRCKYDTFAPEFLQCSSSITHQMVINKIKTIPAFQEYTGEKYD